MFTIAWTIAGAASGWILMDLVPLMSHNKVRTPSIYRAAAALTGALTAYTILT